MLPADRSFLHQRMPTGAVFKIGLIYDEPFWRADGLSGQSFAPGRLRISPSIPALTRVAWQSDGHHRRSRRHAESGKLGVEERRKAVLAAVAERFGEKA